MSRYENSENTLVLFSEFTLNDDMRTALARVFDRIIVVRDRFMPVMRTLDEVKFTRKCLKKVKSIRNERFDNIYMSQERTFDMIMCARAKKVNPKARCYDIEEDAYYSIDEKINADDYVQTSSSKAKLRKFIIRLLYTGYPYNYEESVYCYGMSSEYHGANLLFPQLARRELAGKELIEITSEELSRGIEEIYSDVSTQYPDGDKYALFFFDLMNRYKNLEKVKEIVKEIIEIAVHEGRTVLFKYHPRETEKFDDVDGVYELPHLIPAEKILSDLKGRDVVVMGNATTSCIVAAKLGFEVLSISKIEFPTNKKIHEVMKKMGILCIEDVREIKNIM